MSPLQSASHFATKCLAASQTVLLAVVTVSLLGACASAEPTAGETSETKTVAAVPGGHASGPNSNSAAAATAETATDPAYLLSKGDELAIVVYDESDLSAARRIDNRGTVRMPYLGEISLAGLSVRQAESDLEKMLVDKKLLRNPMVTITVRDYSSREVSVLGAVSTAGKFKMPRETSSIEILDVITGMGGFKATAKSDDVKVTRTSDSGEEKTVTVDVEAMLNPRKGDRSTARSFLIYPGDRIFVPERLW